MATATKKKGGTKPKKAAPKDSQAKKGRVKLPPEQAKQARAMLKQIRVWHQDAADNQAGKAGKQRKLVF
jgi:hypothetical protein